VILLIAALASGSLRPAPVETVSFFNRRCAACHGKDGTLLEERFERKYRDESELKKIIRTMPGASALSGEEMDALVAYMRAISRREAYLIWTQQRDGELEGEIAPADATLKASAKRQSLKVERVGTHRWRVRLPKNVKPAEVELTAERGTRRTTLRLKDSPYSHAKP